MRRVARVSRRTGSAMRSAIDSPIAGAEQDEEQRREVDAAIELVDLALDLALAVGERHGQDRVAAAGADRRRRDHVRERADLILVDEARQPLQHDRAVDIVGRARRQEARGEQVALARREQLGAREDVDVLIDHLADPDHHVVADRRRRRRVAAQERVRLLDHPLRDRRRARRFRLRRRSRSRSAK